ncbi:glycosyltransferase family 39 protein [bacterium]|nr:glycosyltransferase family 39 protein [bacterium]
MTRLLSRSGWVCAGLLALAAGATRFHNALRYPADWGYDASFNVRYIYLLTQRWVLPDPAAGWSTADPPLFFFASALLVREVDHVATLDQAFRALLFANTAVGLAIVALAAALVRRADPENPRRAMLAAGLLLFLPAHIYMSAMINEEILAALFASLVVFALARPVGANGNGKSELRWAARVGLAGGLAVLTKLSGVLCIAAAVASFALRGWRRASLRRAAACIAVAVLVAGLVGGWFYARNRIEYGYFQPHGLQVHERMLTMPPGERSPVDYLRVPLATWTDPQLLNPDLLRSVWGSTYASLWFDGHRSFLPVEGEAVRRLGTLTLLLALLPTLAFAVGVVRGTRRSLRSEAVVDAPLLILTGLTLAGFALYTWRNPWFAVVKGTSLLGLCLPFAFYASEVLDRWTRRRGGVAATVWVLLAALAVAVTFSSTFNLAFEKTEIPGLEWESAQSPPSDPSGATDGGDPLPSSKPPGL